MKILSCLIAVALVPCFAGVSYAQAAKTTGKVKTGKVSKAADLSSIDYYVVDPFYNRITGTCAAGQTVPVDSCLISTRTNKVYNADSNGTLVEVDPFSVRGQYRVVGNKLCYYRPDFTSTKSILEKNAADDEAAGLITARQAKHIKSKLNRMSNYVGSPDGAIYTRSAARAIEYRFIGIQNDLAVSIADTKLRKVKLGLRAEKS